MASLMIGGLGGLAGAAFGLGPLGFLIGSYVGNLLFPPPQPYVNLKLQGSDYGTMIPIVYGTFRVPGNVVWTTDLQPSQQKGKGGPEVTVYSASFQCLLCEGPIVNITKCWADGTLIYDASNTQINTPPWSALYIGDELQGADPTQESIEGAGNVPGYRGTAYVVFSNWPLANYGNRIPNLNFEVVATSPPGELSIILSNYATGQTFVGNAIIEEWDSGGIVISGMNLSDTRTITAINGTSYDPTTLASTGAALPAPTYPCAWSGPPTEYLVGIGFYVFADSSNTPLWRQSGIALHTSGPDNPVVITGGSTYVAPNVVEGSPFLETAGVPTGAGVYICDTVLTPDGTTMLVTTSPTSAGDANKWYLIINGTVTSNGTISPALQLGAFAGVATPHGTPGDPSIMTVGMLEYSSGTYYLWIVAPTGNVEIYVFSGGNLQDWGNGTLAIPFRGEGSLGIECSIRVIGNGFAGVALGQAVVEISRLPVTTGIPLSEIVLDLHERAGLTSGQANVSALTPLVLGYCISKQQDVRSDITPLQSAYYFDAVEQAGVVTYVLRGGDPVASIPANDLAAQEQGRGTPPALVTIKRMQEVDLPAIVYVTYANPDNDYQTGTQMSQRQVTMSQLVNTVDCTAISMEDLKGKQSSGTLLVAAWIERMQFTILTSMKWAFLEPTDVVLVTDENLTYEFRIMSKSDLANGIVQFDGVATMSGIWQQQSVSGSGSGFAPSTPPTIEPVSFLPLNLPLITDTDPYPNGFYAAAALQVAGTWLGAQLYESTDGGAIYSTLATLGTESVMGTATTLLGVFFGGNCIDHLNTVSVTLGPGGGTLSSATLLAVLNGANICSLGPEVLQFLTATLTAPGVYTLQDFLRGRRGTEYQMGSHTIGENFVLLPITDCNTPVSDLGQTRQFKAVPQGGNILAVSATAFLNTGAGLRCYAPTELDGAPDASGNVTINWTRRTRIGGEWADYTDVLLSETIESYVLQIWDATFTVCARVIGGGIINSPLVGPTKINSPTYIYTAAMQMTDFGQLEEHIYCSVGQIGNFGLGTQTRAAILAGGSSDVAPLNPVTPYNAPIPPTPPTTGCSGTIITSNVSWTNGQQSFLSGTDFGPGYTWEIIFPVPASPGNIVVGVQIAEYGGAPTFRSFLISGTPCGAPLQPNASGMGIDANFVMRAGFNPHPGSDIQLPLDQNVYICVTSQGVSQMIANINIYPD